MDVDNKKITKFAIRIYENIGRLYGYDETDKKIKPIFDRDDNSAHPHYSVYGYLTGHSFTQQPGSEYVDNMTQAMYNTLNNTFYDDIQQKRFNSKVTLTDSHYNPLQPTHHEQTLTPLLEQKLSHQHEQKLSPLREQQTNEITYFKLQLDFKLVEGIEINKFMIKKG